MGSILGIMILVFMAVWLFGGILLRIFGMLLILLAAIGLAAGGPLAGLLLLIVGLVLWLAGHWIYAVRWHEWYSPLVERVFCQLLPERMDPTRTWS